jgi:glyoxylase-like metal-dependent hydrolase (beta-lactamase superfamily II)
MTDDVHEIYAIRYAELVRPAAENFIGYDLHDRSLSKLTYFVWAIKGPQGNFVVDTGFDGDMAKRRGRKLDKPIEEGLKAIGVEPDTVANVIVSHLHYDHCGNYNSFPRARYHLQDCEMAYATGRCMCHAALKVPFEADDVTDMVRKVYAGRVAFHDGDEEIAPGISVHITGGHSKGLQAIRVKTRRGYVMLASDSAHLYEHWQKGLIFPLVHNAEAVLEGYEKLKRLATSKDHIIPGHDPLVLEHYPAARAGLEGWVARLDLDPRPV